MDYSDVDTAVKRDVARLARSGFGPEDEILAWITSLQLDYKRQPRTIKAYTEQVERFLRWHREQKGEAAKVDALGVGTLTDYRRHISGTSRNPGSVVYGLRSYLKWREAGGDLEKFGDTKFQPAVCRALAPRGNHAKAKQRMEALSAGEVNTLIEAGLAFRYGDVMHGHRIAFLYASGFRADEMLSMQVRDLESRRDGKFAARCRRSKTRAMNPQTGASDWIPLEWGENYMEEILAMHSKLGSKPDDPLWQTRKGKPLGYNGLCDSLRRIYRRTGDPEIVRKFEEGMLCHLLRHTRLTHLAAEKGNSYWLRDFAGWTSSKMADTYVHSIDLFAEPGKAEPSRAQVRPCPGCGYPLQRTYKLCPMCGERLGHPTTEEEAEKWAAKVAITELLRLPGFQKLVDEASRRAARKIEDVGDLADKTERNAMEEGNEP